MGLGILVLGLTATAAAAPRAFLGSLDRWTFGKSQVTVPVYLSNFSAVTVDSLDFTLAFNFEQLRAASFRSDDSLRSSPQGDSGTWRLTWRKAGGQDYGWIKVADIVMGVKPAFNSGAALVALRAIHPNRRPADSLSRSSFQILAGSPSGLPPGDLNGDSVVTEEDARLGFQNYASGGIELGTYEISRRTPICTHDFALLFRHAIGLMPSLPVSADPAARSGAALSVSTPQNMGNSRFRYTIDAQGVQGVISAEVSLNIISGVVDAVEGGDGLGRDGGLFYGRASGGFYNLFGAQPDSLPASRPSLFTVVVLHRAGQTGQGLSLNSAFLNEGRITGNFTSARNPRGGPTLLQGLQANPVPRPRAFIWPCLEARGSCFNGVGRRLPTSKPATLPR